MTASLFDELRWTDRYHVGQQVAHDGGRRVGVVVAIDPFAGRGCVDGSSLTVEYPDGHRCTFGYDHSFLPLGGEEAGDGAQHDRRPRQDLGSSAPADGAADGPDGSSAALVGATQFSPADGPQPTPHGCMDGQKPSVGESVANESPAAVVAAPGS